MCAKTVTRLLTVTQSPWGRALPLQLLGAHWTTFKWPGTVILNRWLFASEMSSSDSQAAATRRKSLWVWLLYDLNDILLPRQREIFYIVIWSGWWCATISPLHIKLHMHARIPFTPWLCQGTGALCSAVGSILPFNLTTSEMALTQVHQVIRYQSDAQEYPTKNYRL